MLINIYVTVQFRPNPPSPTSGGFISPLLSRIIREETSRIMRDKRGEAVPPAAARQRQRQRRFPPNKKNDKTEDLKRVM